MNPFQRKDQNRELFSNSSNHSNEFDNLIQDTSYPFNSTTTTTTNDQLLFAQSGFTNIQQLSMNQNQPQIVQNCNNSTGNTMTTMPGRNGPDAFAPVGLSNIPSAQTSLKSSNLPTVPPVSNPFSTVLIGGNSKKGQIAMPQFPQRQAQFPSVGNGSPFHSILGKNDSNAPSPVLFHPIPNRMEALYSHSSKTSPVLGKNNNQAGTFDASAARSEAIQGKDRLQSASNTQNKQELIHNKQDPFQSRPSSVSKNGTIKQEPAQNIGIPTVQHSKEYKLQLLSSQWPEKPLLVVNPELCAHLAQLVGNSNFSIEPPQFGSFLMKILPIYGIVLKKLPEVLGKPLNLLFFYSIVSSNGGYRKVTMEQKWPSIGLALLRNIADVKMIPDLEHLLLMLRCIYAKILFPYEQIFLHRIPLNALLESLVPVGTTAPPSALPPKHVPQPPPSVNAPLVPSQGQPVFSIQRTEVPKEDSRKMLMQTNIADTKPANPPSQQPPSISFQTEVEFLRDILCTKPIVNFHNPFYLKKITDFGKVNSRRLRLSLCNETMTDFVYAINALIALSLSTPLPLKSIGWVIDIGIELLRDAFEFLSSFHPDSYPFNGAIGFVIFLRNINFSKEDSEFLALNQEFVHLLLQIASFSRENILSLYCKNILYSISLFLNFDPFDPFILDSLDDFFDQVQEEFVNCSVPLVSTIHNDINEYTNTKYDWTRSIVVRDFRILIGHVGAFNECHQSLVLISNTFQWIRSSRRKQLYHLLWKSFLFPIFTGPLFKFVFGLLQLYIKLSKSDLPPLYSQLYNLWYQGLIGNEQFCLQDFKNIELALEFCIACLEFGNETSISNEMIQFEIICNESIVKLYLLLIRIFTFHPFQPNSPGHPSSNRAAVDSNQLINTKLVNVTILLGRILENYCLSNNESIIQELKLRRETILQALVSTPPPHHHNQTVPSWKERLSKQLGYILSFL